MLCSNISYSNHSLKCTCGAAARFMVWESGAGSGFDGKVDCLGLANGVLGRHFRQPTRTPERDVIALAHACTGNRSDDAGELVLRPIHCQGRC